MKKFFSLAVALMLSALSFAQTEAGGFFFAPKVGVNTGYVTDISESTDRRVNMAFGVEVGYQMTEKFAITADALYSAQGYQIEFNVAGYDYHNTLKTDYLNIPILANYYIVKGLAIKAGIQPGFCVSAKQDFNLPTIGKFDGDVKSAVNTVDFSIPVGASYEYKNIILDMRYNFGLTNVTKDSEKGTKNSVFQITLGYKLPF